MNRTTYATTAFLMLSLAEGVQAFGCQILKGFPAEIDRPGKYCLDPSHDLALTGNAAAISVFVNDAQRVRGDGAGIATADGNNNLVVENRVQNAEIGFRLDLGAEVRYRNNLTAATQRAYAGTATDLSNND